MIGTACCFYKVIWKINIPLAENDPSIQFEARLRFVEKKKKLCNSQYLKEKIEFYS